MRQGSTVVSALVTVKQPAACGSEDGEAGSGGGNRTDGPGRDHIRDGQVEVELQRGSQPSSWVRPWKPNLPLELRGKAGDCARITAGAKGPHLGVVPFSSLLQSFPASGSFQMSQFFTSGGQSIIREPLLRRQGSQVSIRVARGSASWLSSHGRGLGPRDALKKDSRGLSRGAAGNPRFPRLLQGNLGNFPGCLCAPGLVEVTRNIY